MTKSLELWPVAVFAHNESRHIVRCLDTLLANRIPGKVLEIHVLANGCSDNTEALVAEFARANPCVHLHQMEVGDKANAWNSYLHHIAPASDLHFFIDGDVEACEHALEELAKALSEHPDANAAAALPRSGRSLDATCKEMIREADLAGNLYALSGSFARRIRERKIYMPVGFIGEDSLVGAFAKWNLDPNGGWDDARIVPCPTANFYFKSLSWLDGDHWRLYWNRRIRYSMRRLQLTIYRRSVKQKGLSNMPVHVRELYRDAQDLPAPESGTIDRLFNRLAVRRIRKQMAMWETLRQPG